MLSNSRTYSGRRIAGLLGPVVLTAISGSAAAQTEAGEKAVSSTIFESETSSLSVVMSERIIGYQDPANFYYVHLGKKADDHANQIFIVNEAPRTKISLTSTPGTNWDDAWHTVKIVRRVSEGGIEIFFDDMDKPVMTAKNGKFAWGRLGVGSFDDTSHWDDIKVYGEKVEKPRP